MDIDVNTFDERREGKRILNANFLKKDRFRLDFSSCDQSPISCVNHSHAFLVNKLKW